MTEVCEECDGDGVIECLECPVDKRCTYCDGTRELTCEECPDPILAQT